MSSQKSLYFDEQRVNELATHGFQSLETLKGWLGEVGPRERDLWGQTSVQVLPEPQCCEGENS